MTNSNSVRVRVGVHMMKPHDTTRPASFLLGFFFFLFFSVFLLFLLSLLYSQIWFLLIDHDSLRHAKAIWLFVVDNQTHNERATKSGQEHQRSSHHTRDRTTRKLRNSKLERALSEIEPSTSLQNRTSDVHVTPKYLEAHPNRPK